MSHNADIIAELNYGRAFLLEVIAELSVRERTETSIYGEWTIKDLLAHLIGWDERILNTLPLMLRDRAYEVPAVNADRQNLQAVTAWKDRSLDEVLARVHASHQEILEIISSLDQAAIDRRHERGGRTITIRSYVLDTMIEHERRHALEIESWRKDLEHQIDPAGIKAQLTRARIEFMASLDELADPEAEAKDTDGKWSVSEMVGHVADWEKLILGAARHLQDPEMPEVVPIAADEAEANANMVARRADKSWPENYHFLLNIQKELDHFLTSLGPDAWSLRGPYPWANDRGTLAELIVHIAEHYVAHLPDLTVWTDKRPGTP